MKISCVSKNLPSFSVLCLGVFLSLFALVFLLLSFLSFVFLLALECEISLFSASTFSSVLTHIPLLIFPPFCLSFSLFVFLFVFLSCMLTHSPLSLSLIGWISWIF